MFVPFVNLVMPFVLGTKGYQWAWANKRWESEEQFLKNQREWTKWALIVYAATVVVTIVVIVITFGLVFGATSENAPISIGMEMIRNDSACREYLGSDIEKAFGWRGSISSSGPGGSADISFKVRGNRASARCYLKAHKETGEWRIELLVVRNTENEQDILRFEDI